MRRTCLLLVGLLGACAADNNGGAAISDAIASGSRPGLRADYFDGYHDRKLGRVEANVDHVWGAASPGAAIGEDRFSARWTGTLTPKVAGRTRIGIDGDDGVRVWIDGKLVIDDWRAHFEERHSAEVTLDPSRPVSIRVDYFEADQDAQIQLWWSAAGVAEEIIPASQFTTSDGPSTLPGPKPPITNPVMPESCADPGVMAADGAFFMACTGGSLSVKRSRDLVTWTPTSGSILPEGKPDWAVNGDRNWAPEIHEIGRQFLAYYTTVNDANVLSIGVASAPSPTGPYRDLGKPLVEDDLGVIDATQFTDDDGSAWLIYKIDGNSDGERTPIFIRRLTSDGLAFAPGSAPKQILTNDPDSWEGGVVEAPWLVKRNGTYFLLYAGNVYDQRYRTGVARASNLLGPYEKKGAPVLTNNGDWLGPGHGSVVPVPVAGSAMSATQDYFVYHAWRNHGDGVANHDEGRKVLIDRITWSNGWPRIGNGTPTTGPQPWPGEPR